MKKSTKLVALISVVAILVSAVGLAAFAIAYEVEKPVDSGMWSKNDFDTDHAYSIAFVGDTQYITCGDYYLGTEKLQYQFKMIADTAEERKLEHLFVLGDITDLGYRNDYNLGAGHNKPILFKEWEIAQKAIFQLNGITTYSLCRGNHDDYMMDDYFNVPEYTDQFKDCGGFFSDSEAKHPKTLNPLQNKQGYVYWSAKTGKHHEESIVNSWMTKEIYGTKYLFVTVDYNPTQKVFDWLDELLGQYPEHKAIITMHSYLRGDGTLSDDETGNTMFPLGYTPDKLWDQVLRKHANVLMVVSGHTGGVQLTSSYNYGDNGNRVLQVLVDPQAYDAKEIKTDGTIEHGTQDTGLVLYMNFSEDGTKVSFDYYSTLLDKFLKGNDYVYNLGDTVDEVGSIDMADLTQFGQVTPLVTEIGRSSLDGRISAGEYTYTKTTPKDKIGLGSINGDLTEYFSYDDDYIYYAFSGKMNAYGYQFVLHTGSSLYTPEEINGNLHSEQIVFTLSPSGFTVNSNNVGARPMAGQDFFCAGTRNSSTGEATYEIKIKRSYLSGCNSPDNLLSYTLKLGNNIEVRTAINKEAREVLSEMGVTKKYYWTYNYAYFGSRPEVTPEEPETETETTVETEPDTTVADTVTEPDTTAADTTATPDENKGGCGSAVSMITVGGLMLAFGVTALCRKKKED